MYVCYQTAQAVLIILWATLSGYSYWQLLTLRLYCVWGGA